MEDAKVKEQAEIREARFALEERAARWAKFRRADARVQAFSGDAYESQLIVHIGKLYIHGELSYLTALLYTIDMLSRRCREIKERGGELVMLTDIPEQAAIFNNLKLDMRDGDLERTEQTVLSLTSGERRMVAELAKCIREEIPPAIFVAATAENEARLRRMGLKFTDPNAPAATPSD